VTKLDDNVLITPALIQRFENEGVAEGGDGRYYAMVRTSDGNIRVHHPGYPNISPDQKIWAIDMLNMLNTVLHHDGAWVVVFTNIDVLGPPKRAKYDRYAWVWVDADGDPQFTSDWVEGHGEADLRTFADVAKAGIVSGVDRCEAAWQQWRFSRKVLDLSQKQTFKRARGERAPSSVH
jgi:hypothetical protein